MQHTSTDHSGAASPMPSATSWSITASSSSRNCAGTGLSPRRSLRPVYRATGTDPGRLPRRNSVMSGIACGSWYDEEVAALGAAEPGAGDATGDRFAVRPAPGRRTRRRRRGGRVIVPAIPDGEILGGRGPASTRPAVARRSSVPTRARRISTMARSSGDRRATRRRSARRGGGAHSWICSSSGRLASSSSGYDDHALAPEARYERTRRPMRSGHATRAPGRPCRPA